MTPSLTATFSRGRGARAVGRERGGWAAPGAATAEVEQSIVSGDVQSKRADDDEGGTSVADDDVVDGGGEGGSSRAAIRGR